MTFPLHQGGVIVSSQITPTQSSDTHPLVHIPSIYTLNFCSCAFFYSLLQPHHMVGPKECMAKKNGPIKLNNLHMPHCSALHSFLSSALSRSLDRHPSATQGHRFSQSQPRPYPYQPSTYFRHQHPSIVVRYSSISTCPNHLNTL